MGEVLRRLQLSNAYKITAFKKKKRPNLSHMQSVHKPLTRGVSQVTMSVVRATTKKRTKNGPILLVVLHCTYVDILRFTFTVSIFLEGDLYTA